METLTQIISILSNNIALMNNFMLLAFFVVFGYLFLKESKNNNSPINWTDMMLDAKTGKTSLTKLGQFWGVAFSSWIAVFFAQKVPADRVVEIYPWVFGVWLAFLIGSYSVNAIMKTKDGATTEIKKEGE